MASEHNKLTENRDWSVTLPYIEWQQVSQGLHNHKTHLEELIANDNVNDQFLLDIVDDYRKTTLALDNIRKQTS